MLRICYSGTLEGFNPAKIKYKKNSVLDWFWSFNNINADPSTRTGYYLINAVNLLVKNHKITPQQLQIELWGKIDAQNKIQIETLGLTKYFQLDSYLSKETSLNKLLSADLLFLPLEKSTAKEHKTLFIPGKLYEYLNTGVPILAPCEPSDCKNILEQSGMAICTEPDNAEMIANVLLNFINNKDLLRKFTPDKQFINSFSFVNKTKELANIFDSLR